MNVEVSDEELAKRKANKNGREENQELQRGIEAHVLMKLLLIVEQFLKLKKKNK